MIDRPMINNFETPTASWTGRLDIDLSNGHGQHIGTVEIVIRIDNLTLWFGNRTLAVLDRDSFREWLIHPSVPYELDDVVWSTEGTSTYLSIDYSPPYAVSPDVIDHLVAVI